jgi:hypothetical protein
MSITETPDGALYSPNRALLDCLAAERAARVTVGGAAQGPISGYLGSNRWPSTTAAATSTSLELLRRDWSRSIAKASASSTE